MASITLQRRYEFDWLRVLAILIVFLYHSTRFFNLTDWHIKNANNYVWIEIGNVFVTRWMMPLFFIISGASLYFVIGKQGGWKRFYTDKFLRLMIPVLFASLTHSALQVYLERVSHSRFSGSFFQFIPAYFNGVYSGIGLAGSGNFANVGMHLWYLLFLFGYGLICYPLFVWLKTGGKRLLEQFTGLISTQWVVYLGFTIPLLIMKVLIPHAIIDVGNGGWGFLYYLWFLIAGFIFMSSEQLQHCVERQRWVSLLLGVILSSAYLYMLFGVSHPVFQGECGNWMATLLNFFSAWCWILAILGFSMQHLSFDRPVLHHLNEGVLPFFILHQTVLLVFGYFIMKSEVHDFLKWAAVFIISFVFIIALYLILIQRIDLFRFLFGMKTSHPFFDIFQKKGLLIFLPALWVTVTVFAGFNKTPVARQHQYPMSLSFDPAVDVVLNADFISDLSPTGVQVVNDGEASFGNAIEFSSGGNKRVDPDPDIYVDIHFSAPAGRYFVWIRGKSDVDNELTDSIWLQVDNQIGTQQGTVHLGNWNSFYPVSVYAWASDFHIPIVSVLRHTGEHTIRIQPRQTPHRIDQIWLSNFQRQIPNTTNHIKRHQMP